MAEFGNDHQLNVLDAIVMIRRGDGWNVRPDIVAHDGATIKVSRAWLIGDPADEPGLRCSRYAGEYAWIPEPESRLPGMPSWYAEGDLWFGGASL